MPTMLTWTQAASPMHVFVLALLYAVAAFFVLLVGIIVVSKGWREIVEARLRRRRTELEPVFFKYAVGKGPLDQYLPRAIHRSERVLVENIFFDLGRVV